MANDDICFSTAGELAGQYEELRVRLSGLRGDHRQYQADLQLIQRLQAAGARLVLADGRMVYQSDLLPYPMRVVKLDTSIIWRSILGAATNVPLPARRTNLPSRTRSEIARRTVMRATP